MKELEILHKNLSDIVSILEDAADGSSVSAGYAMCDAINRLNKAMDDIDTVHSDLSSHWLEVEGRKFFLGKELAAVVSGIGTCDVRDYKILYYDKGPSF